jgi:anti-sigma regulatory factor (Ser/Thr protein kinase)
VTSTWAHAAAVIDSDEGLAATAASYLRPAIEQGDLAVVGCRRPVADLIVDALGDLSRFLVFDERICLFAVRAPEAFARNKQLATQAAERGSGRLRLLAQVDFGDHPRDVREGQCFEAAANVLRPPIPMSSLCLYDARRLPKDLVSSARATHPYLVEDDRRVVSHDFVAPADLIRRLPVPREPVEDLEPLLAVDDAPTLAGLRHAIARVLDTAVHDREQREDLHLACSEMAANAFRHGGRPVSARVWASPDRMVVTITDSGSGFDDPLYGYWPAHGDDLGKGGMGLWLARKLCDHVDLQPGPGGLTVRLNTALR